MSEKQTDSRDKDLAGPSAPLKKSNQQIGTKLELDREIASATKLVLLAFIASSCSPHKTIPYASQINRKE